AHSPLRQYALLVLIIAVAAGAALHRTPSTAEPQRRSEPPAAVVNGLPVAMAAYQRQLRFATNSYSGPRVARQTPTGRTMLQLLENQAINQAIAEVLIDHIAAQYHVTASAAELTAELARMTQAAGGVAALRQQAHAAGMSMDDLRQVARHTVLRDRLAVVLHDPAWLNHMAAAARITYYVGDDAAAALTPTIALGALAPPFVAEDLHGRAVSLADLAGRPVVLTFWATTCDWCRQELPLLLRFAHTNPAISVIALDRQEDAATVRAYIHASQLQGLTVWLDGSGQAATDYTVSQLPVTFFIDRRGILRSYTFGPLANMQALQEQASAAVRGVDTTD
ncbi:MAG TPA: redoxin domain-containing protein, partial [Chloroflexota bacterium]|nr:redoxin domain-containing protein [Chloroflexota bacterium]